MTGRLTLKCEAGKRNCCCLWKEPKPNQNCNLQSRSQIHEIDIIPNTVKLVYWVDHTILYTSHLSCTILQVGRGSTRDEVVFLLFFFLHALLSFYPEVPLEFRTEQKPIFYFKTSFFTVLTPQSISQVKFSMKGFRLSAVKGISLRGFQEGECPFCELQITGRSTDCSLVRTFTWIWVWSLQQKFSMLYIVSGSSSYLHWAAVEKSLGPIPTVPVDPETVGVL